MVCRARSQRGRYLVGILKTWFGAPNEKLDLPIEVLEVFVVYALELLSQVDLLGSELVGFCEIGADRLTQLIFSWIRVMAAVSSDPALDLQIAVLDGLDAIVIYPVLVEDFVLDEAQLLRQVLGAVSPVLENGGGVLDLCRGRHPLDKVDGQVVSRHCAGLASGRRRERNSGGRVEGREVESMVLLDDKIMGQGASLKAPSVVVLGESQGVVQRLDDDRRYSGRDAYGEGGTKRRFWICSG